MGEITIKVPQRIRKSFDISNRVVADRILKELEERSVDQPLKVQRKRKDLARLTKFMKGYRSNPDNEILLAIATAEELRKGWER